MILAALELAYGGWIKTYRVWANDRFGMAKGYSVRETTDGGYIIAGMRGEVSPEGEANMEWWLLKTDEYGDTIWTRIYGTAYQDQALCVQQTSDGGYIMTGYIYGDWVGDGGYVWLLKTDDNGDTLWSKKYGSKYGYSKAYWVEQTSDGGYIVTGDYIGGYLWLLKTDKNGDTLWTLAYDNGGSEIGYCVQQTSHGGYIIAASMGLMKTDSVGGIEWVKPWPGYCTQEVSDGGYIIIGRTWAGSVDVRLRKTDANGDTLWTRTYGGGDEEDARCVQETSDSGYVIFGSSASFGGGWILKTDSDGDTLWTRIYEDCGFSSGQQTADGGYIITGSTTAYGNACGDLLLIKTDSLGYVGVEEPVPVTHQPDWEVVNPIGREVVLRYHDKPGGFHAKIYDISGKKCDECNVNLPSSCIRWGQNVPRGVYFIREESEHHSTTQKVILIR